MQFTGPLDGDYQSYTLMGVALLPLSSLILQIVNHPLVQLRLPFGAAKSALWCNFYPTSTKGVIANSFRRIPGFEPEPLSKSGLNRAIAMVWCET